ncbi:MAG: glutathione S-transferase [Gammaproteobacteria bacterium]|nr:glutathione S-transferase [Gammaproteobacteria bacterium]
MEPISVLNVTPIYIAILGLLFLPITVRIALYRIKSRISLGTGDDPEMLRLMRGQANFVETVPMALFLLIIMEVLGASNVWLHALGLMLVLGRIVHYFGLIGMVPFAFRIIGIAATLLTILLGSIWISIDVLLPSVWTGFGVN